MRPTIAGIERTAALVGVAVAAVFYALVSPAAGLACLVGSVVMIVNFFLLAIVGGAIVGIARRSGPSRVGILLAPLKLIFLVAVLYVLVSRFRINIAGLVAGILTLFAAIFIETWRTSRRLKAGAEPGTEGNKA